MDKHQWGYVGNIWQSTAPLSKGLHGVCIDKQGNMLTIKTINGQTFLAHTSEVKPYPSEQ